MDSEIRTLEKTRRAARRASLIFCAIFGIIGLLFLALLVLAAVSLMGLPEGTAAMATASPLLFAIVQDLAMISMLAICVLIAVDIAKGQTPFSQKQRKRVLAIAWIMVAFTVFCFFWNPFTASIIPTDTFSYSITNSDNPTNPRLNVESLILSLACFFFGHMMKYGMLLQQLADDTV